MDVSHAVDALFGGVVPERSDEMKAMWSDADRVRLLDVPRFLLQAAFGPIQVSEKALRVIWLNGYASWAALEAYNVRMVWERLHNNQFDPALWNTYPQQRILDDNFDRLLANVRALDNCESLEDFDWPQDIPKPAMGLRITDVAQKATFDLICMGGAFVFAHELRHALYDRDGGRPDTLIAEERECDRWALALMLDGVPHYASETKQDEGAVRAKRVLGVVLAQLTILAMTPRHLWEETGEYPAVRERVRSVLDALVDPVPEGIWLSVASMLAAYGRNFKALPPSMPFPPADRELAYMLCDALRAA